MAEFIFTEIYEKWQSEGAINFSRITELTNLINQEIVDLDKINHYRELISKALNEYQEGWSIMADANDFVDRVSKIEGIDGCLLIRKDGKKIAQTVSNPQDYLTLMKTSSIISGDIMDSIGYGYCPYLSFTLDSMDQFYIFQIDNYLLWVLKLAQCHTQDMLDTVYSLIGKVSTGASEGMV